MYFWVISFAAMEKTHKTSRAVSPKWWVSQIFNMLENVSFGPHYFQMALLFRESMLINGIITNAEIWYNLNKSEIEEFESLDRLFFRRLLEVPITTPNESYYLELGVLPVGTLD